MVNECTLADLDIEEGERNATKEWKRRFAVAKAAPCLHYKVQRCEDYTEVASHTIGSAGTRDGAICLEDLFKMQSCHRQEAWRAIKAPLGLIT